MFIITTFTHKYYNLDSSTGIDLENRQVTIRLLARAGNFIFSKEVHSRSRANPTSSSMGQSPPPSAEVKNEWCSPNLSPNALMARRGETVLFFTHKYCFCYINRPVLKCCIMNYIPFDITSGENRCYTLMFSPTNKHTVYIKLITLNIS